METAEIMARIIAYANSRRWEKEFNSDQFIADVVKALFTKEEEAE